MYNFLKLILFLSCFTQGYSQIDTIRLYIQSGDLLFFDNVAVHHRVFASSATQERNSSILILDQNEAVYLRIINNSSENHGLKIDGVLEIPSTLPGDSSGIEFSFPDAGIFRFYDPSNDYQPYLGLSGLLHVKASGDLNSYFYWDIREFRKEWSVNTSSTNLPDPLTYSPQYFSINGNTSPEIDLDPLAKITGNVGQEIRLIILNNGLSIHSMHFHGYHATLMQSSRNPEHVNRSKDTFPVYPSEFILLSFTPDKPGEYPVHDHNLVAVTGGGIYHAGMITTLVIEP
jgi:hypothetical protein